MPNVDLFDFEEFSPIFGKIYLPENTLLYRGYDARYPVISDRPAYYTCKPEVALGYVRNSNHKISAFKSKKFIMLYDIRYIKNILIELFSQIQSKDADVIRFCKILTISYGLTSCKRQLDILQEFFGNDLNDYYMDIRSYILKFETAYKKGEIFNGIGLFEAQGIRIGETSNDAISVSFLKDLFGKKVDGFIAPKLKSPFHNKQGGYNPAEIVLFKPIDTVEEIIDDLNSYVIRNISFQNFFSYKSEDYFNLKPKLTKKLDVNYKKVNKVLDNTSMYITGGYINNSHASASNYILDKGGENYEKIQEFVKSTLMKLFGDDYYDEVIYVEDPVAIRNAYLNWLKSS